MSEITLPYMQLKPKVNLLHHTPLWVTGHAIRTCWQSQEKSDTQFVKISNGGEIEDGTPFDHHDAHVGKNDCELIDRIGNKFKHASTLEHVYINFYVSGISRALLQELARHRMASLSVKSTRYTLKELKNEAPFIPNTDDVKILKAGSTLYQSDVGRRASEYLVYAGEEMVDWFSINALENLRQALVAGISNDRAKYCLPESYKTELTWTINIRSLQNFIYLRSDKAALWEIRDLANEVFNALPKELKYLFGDHLKEYADVVKNG